MEHRRRGGCIRRRLRHLLVGPPPLLPRSTGVPCCCRRRRRLPQVSHLVANFTSSQSLPLQTSREIITLSARANRQPGRVRRHIVVIWFSLSFEARLRPSCRCVSELGGRELGDGAPPRTLWGEMLTRKVLTKSLFCKKVLDSTNNFVEIDAMFANRSKLGIVTTVVTLLQCGI